MNSKSSIVLAVICLAAGVIIGLSWPRHVEQKLPDHTNASPLTNPKSNLALAKTPLLTPSRIPALERLRAAISKAPVEIQILDAWLAINELTASECDSAIELVRRVPQENNSLLEGIATRWAKLDPSGLEEALLRRRSDFIQSILAKHWANALVAVGVDSALNRIDPLTGIQKLELGRTILIAAMKVDPLKVVEFLAANPIFQKDGSVTSQLAGELARVNPAAAFDWLSQIPNRSVRDQAERAAWRRWAEMDPAVVATKLQGKENLRSDLLSVIGRSWMRSDPAAAIAWMNTITNRKEALAALQSIEFKVADVGLEKARELITHAKDTNLQNRLLQSVVTDLASKEVHEALAFLNQFENRKSVPGVLGNIVHYWMQDDTPAATQYVLGLPESNEKADILRTAIQHWVSRDSAEVTAFVQQLPAGKDRDVAMVQVVQMLSQSEPATGLNYLRSIQDAKLAGEAAQTLLGVMALTDPKNAAAIAAQLPADSQPLAFGGLVQNWAAGDAHAAGEWINTLPPGAGRDAAIESYAGELKQKDPATAIHWAFTIDEPKARTEATMDSFHRWTRTDPTAAAAWLQQAEIGEGLRPFFEHELKQAVERNNRGFE